MLKLVGNGQWPTFTSSTVFKSNSPVFSIHNFHGGTLLSTIFNSLSNYGILLHVSNLYLYHVV